jgi:tetratricopeptide (TPR) repeat protein
MDLYQAAVSATLERGPNSIEAQARLDKAKKDANDSDLAHRLQLRVSHERVDLEGFLLSWSHLREQFETTSEDHLLHWRLLTQCNRKSEAIQAAQRHVQRPRTPHEVIEIADAYSRLGLKKHAIRYLSNYAPDLGFNGMHFYAQAQLLTAEKRWGDLIGLALAIRSSENLSVPLIAFSYFVEGKGEFRRGRKTAATTAFNQIASYSTKANHYGIYIGSNLWELGFPKAAHALLTHEQERYRNRIAYWELMFDIGLALKLQSPLLQAAENLFRLSPETTHYEANYASLLISQRIRHDEALALAFNAHSQSPENAGMKINYGQALLLNRRIDEARSIFREIDSKRLDTSQRQGYFLAITDLLYHEGRIQEAIPILKKIIPGLLLPGDRAFLDSLRSKLIAESNGV